MLRQTSSQSRQSTLAIALIVLATFADYAPALGEPAAETQCEIAGGIPKSSMLSFVAKSARSNVPQEVQVQGPGPLYVTMHRTLAQFKGQARVEIDRRDGAGEFQDGCRTEWISTDKPIAVRSSATASGVSIWRVRIYDSAEGGPTGEFPYVIDVNIRAPLAPGGPRLTAVLPFPPDKPFAGDGSEPSHPCGTSATPIRERSTLEIARATSNQNIRSGTPWLWFVTAGRYLYLKVTADHPVKVRARIYAKEPSGLAFRGICESILELPPISDQEYLTAMADWDRVIHPLWRVEIEPIGEDGKPTFSSIHATAFRETGSEPQASGPVRLDPGSLAWQVASDCYQCRAWARGAARAPVAQQSSTSVVFAIATGLAIDLPDDLGAEGSTLLLRSLRTAIGIWLANCRTCNYDAMSVIRIGPQYWLRSDIANPVVGPGQPGNVLDRLKGNRFLSRAATAAGGVELFGDAPITEDKRLSVCAMNSGQEPPELYRVKVALKCFDTSAPEGQLTSITLLMPTDRPTACGRGANIIACEEDAALVEFNGRDYRFCVGTDIFSCVGIGPRSVDLMQIMLHEVGHWIGLGHSDSADSIMASTMQISRCITNADVDSLQNLTSQAPPARSGTSAIPRAFRLSEMDD